MAGYFCQQRYAKTRVRSRFLASSQLPYGPWAGVERPLSLSCAEASGIRTATSGSSLQTRSATSVSDGHARVRALTANRKCAPLTCVKAYLILSSHSIADP
ncbi:hypothetical protein ROHU_009421 [Labeo rohita]|uniref:Uncharacterized protein n=1 Tax=Labeo rohita TaxID=84645 RepID=A0A498M829_LABRO|nr:hypothetical protein ROHU_009421 [Labeo rohita]